MSPSVVSAEATVMALLAMVSVGLWTLRVALAARGRRLAGAAVAAVEAVVFAMVFSSLVGDLESWDRVAGYAAGVAVGTVGGLVVNDRMNPGGTVVEAVVPGDGAELRQAFHARGWPATAVPAAGVHGPATVLYLVVRSQRADTVLDVVRAVAPQAFLSTRPAAVVRGVPGMATSVTL